MGSPNLSSLDEYDSQTLFELRKHVADCEAALKKAVSEKKLATANLEGAQAALFKFIDECQDGLPLFGGKDDKNDGGGGGGRGGDHGPPDVPPPIPPSGGVTITVSDYALSLAAHRAGRFDDPDNADDHGETIIVDAELSALALPAPSPAVDAVLENERLRKPRRSKGK